MKIDWVSVLFRLANFGIFIAFMVYLYRRYLKDFITQQMKADISIEQGLVAEQVMATQMHEQYQQLVARKKEQQVRVQNTIEQWRKEVERVRADELLERNNRLLASKHRAELQAQQLRKEVMARRVMPEVLSAARQELQELYASEAEGNRVMQQIIFPMRESKS
jgi:hypothetical protein